MSVVKLAKVHIVTVDVPALARFYEAVVGTAAVGSDEYVELRIDGGTLALCSQRAMAVCGARAVTAARNGSMILDFEVNDVDASRYALKNVVSEFVLEPTTAPWGNRTMLFRDPDGNLISFFSQME